MLVNVSRASTKRIKLIFPSKITSINAGSFPMQSTRNFSQPIPPKGFENFPPPKNDKKDNGNGKGKVGGDNKEKNEPEKKRTPPENPPPEDNNTSDTNRIKMILAVIGVLVAFAIYMTREKCQEITYLQFQNELLVRGHVSHLKYIKNKDKVRVFIKGESVPRFYFTVANIKLFEQQLADAISRMGMGDEFAPVKYGTGFDGIDIIHWTPTALFFISSFIWIYYLVQLQKKTMRGSGGDGGILGYGKSKAILSNKAKINVSFKDVAGCEEAKQEVSEFVSFLKNPSRYTALGAKIPKGALLVGPPGTGKTLLAKATAGEAMVPFYSVSGSDFIEIFGGVGPARVRDLFATARKSAPCIIFVDEIDAIGRKRGSMGRSDERDNTLNQLLVEMDGFENNKGIIVLAGTNRPDILDNALLRPGRFDRRISIDLPDIKAREEIFEVHLKSLKLNEEVTVKEYAKKLAALTPGFSGADIANVCNEAALFAARNNKTSVGIKEFNDAVDRVIAGLEKRSKVLSPEEKKIVAYHEAGHAVVGWLLPNTDPILKVSIIPRGTSTLGFAQQQPEERYLHSKEFIHDRVCVLLGGRVAEELTFGEVTSGAVDDLEKVTQIAYSTITKYGMNASVGHIAWSDRNSKYWGKPYSENTAEIVDLEVSKMIQNCYIRTKNLLKQHTEQLDTLAKELLTKEVIQQEDVKRILGPKITNTSEQAQVQEQQDKQDKQQEQDKQDKQQDSSA